MTLSPISLNSATIFVTILNSLLCVFLLGAAVLGIVTMIYIIKACRIYIKKNKDHKEHS